MTPEERALLQRMAQTVEENNEILHGIRSSMRWARVWRVVYWTVIIGSAVGAYWFIQPYIDTLLGLYTNAQTNINTMKGILGS
jgi:hypothetical protein